MLASTKSKRMLRSLSSRPMRRAAFHPRSFSGRSKSSRLGSSQLDLACRNIASLFIVPLPRQESLHPSDRNIERDAADRNARRKSFQEPRRHRRRQNNEDAAIALPPD